MSLFQSLNATLRYYSVQFSSVQFNCSVVSDSLRPHELQHARPPCPSPTPGVHPNPCPLSRWCHSTISPSVIPFSSCPQSFPASGSFPMSQLFTSGGQSIIIPILLCRNQGLRFLSKWQLLEFIQICLCSPHLYQLCGGAILERASITLMQSFKTLNLQF